MRKYTSSRMLKVANAFLLFSLFFYWFETSSFLNPVAIFLFIVLGLHMFVARGPFKFIFPSLFIIINLYMFLALFSEFSEFPILSMEAISLLLVGTLYLGLNIASSVIIIGHYLSRMRIHVNS